MISNSEFPQSYVFLLSKHITSLYNNQCIFSTLYCPLPFHGIIEESMTGRTPYVKAGNYWYELISYIEFITAAHQTGHYHLQAVYSRKMETAQEFCEPYGAISRYTDVIDFLQ